MKGAKSLINSLLLPPKLEGFGGQRRGAKKRCLILLHSHSYMHGHLHYVCKDRSTFIKLSSTLF
jgi:hypothetical protein